MAQALLTDYRISAQKRQEYNDASINVIAMKWTASSIKKKIFDMSKSFVE